MDLTSLRESVAASDVVVAVGSRTQWQVGGPAPQGTEVRPPSGIVSYDPADLTIAVGAGTPVTDLDEVLAASRQECPLDPHDRSATVGGVLACGLSGHRRLRHGPVRDRVLEMRVVLGDGRLLKAGGPTVKNVSGYDVPRLFVGSLGTLGVIARVTLRCQPRPAAAQWGTTSADPFALRRRFVRPSCIAWDGARTWCLLEGHPRDVDAEMGGAALDPVESAPARPEGACRGRISIEPANLEALGAQLASITGLGWMAEVGVGTVHVAADDPGPVVEARQVAHRLGGWLLREAGDFDGFGRALPNEALMRRIKGALDPSRTCNPGRLPL